MGVEWIRTGAVGSEARGGRKTRQSESQMVAQCMFGTAVRYGRGNFPKKYARTDIEGVRIGAAAAAAAAEK